MFYIFFRINGHPFDAEMFYLRHVCTKWQKSQKNVEHFGLKSGQSRDCSSVVWRHIWKSAQEDFTADMIVEKLLFQSYFKGVGIDWWYVRNVMDWELYMEGKHWKKIFHQYKIGCMYLLQNDISLFLAFSFIVALKDLRQWDSVWLMYFPETYDLHDDSSILCTEEEVCIYTALSHICISIAFFIFMNAKSDV